MHRMMAIIERDLRKFLRSPALMMAAMVFPLVQLIVLGNAFGGKIHDARLGIVDQEAGASASGTSPQALRIRQALDAIHANARTITPIDYPDEKTAVRDIRNGKIDAALVIPPQFSRDVYLEKAPRLGLVVDNTDNFMTSTSEDNLNELMLAPNQPAVHPRMVKHI